MSIYSSGRNNSYFPNANLFMPERWNRNETKNEVIDPYASLPFGHGKRACIGRRLAEAQMYILLYKVGSGSHLHYHIVQVSYFQSASLIH